MRNKRALMKLCSVVIKENKVESIVQDEFLKLSIGDTHEEILSKVDEMGALLFRELPFGEGLSLIVILESNEMSYYESKLGETAHEIKNAIAVSLSAMMIVKKKFEKKDFTNKILDKMIDDSIKSSKKIVPILEKSRSELKEVQKKQTVELASFFNDFQNDISALISINHIDFIFIDNGHNLKDRFVDLNGITLDQLILNLIKNACEAFTEDIIDRKVQLEVEFTETDVLISVSDNGSGIPLESSKKIFLQFYTTKGDFGSGIGLYLVKRYLNLSSGDIELDQTVEKGARFIVRLPYYEG